MAPSAGAVPFIGGDGGGDGAGAPAAQRGGGGLEGGSGGLAGFLDARDGGGDGGGEGGAIGGGAAFDEDARFPLEVWRSVDVEITLARRDVEVGGLAPAERGGDGVGGGVDGRAPRWR